MYKRIMHVVANIVYWASLVGPVYSLVKGAIDGVVAGIQSIRADDELRRQISDINDLPTDYVDLTGTVDAQKVDCVFDLVKEVK